MPQRWYSRRLVSAGPDAGRGGRVYAWARWARGARAVGARGLCGTRSARGAARRGATCARAHAASSSRLHPKARACTSSLEMQARRMPACGCACVWAGLPRSGGRQPRSCSARCPSSCPSCASCRPAAPRREAATARPPDLSAAAPRAGGPGSDRPCVARVGGGGKAGRKARGSRPVHSGPRAGAGSRSERRGLAVSVQRRGGAHFEGQYFGLT